MKTMGYLTLIALLLIPAGVLAQMHGGGMHGGTGQHMMGPEYQANEETMNMMRRDMDQMRGHRSLTPENQREMQQMMNELDEMQQHMRSTQGPSRQGHYHGRLQHMQRRLDDMKRQMR